VCPVSIGCGIHAELDTPGQCSPSSFYPMIKMMDSPGGAKCRARRQPIWETEIHLMTI
jgi:hypothetical protein